MTDRRPSMPAPVQAMRLERPLAVFDLGATGLDVGTARVVEVAVVRVGPDGTSPAFHRRVNPGAPIPPAAAAVHNIADGDVAGCPPSKAVAPELFGTLAGTDLAGLGIARFDVPLLAAEFARAGIEFSLAGRAVVAALAIFHRHERRDLAAAVKVFLGREHAGAHSALADARATWPSWTPRWPGTPYPRPRPPCTPCSWWWTSAGGSERAGTATSSSASASTPGGPRPRWPERSRHTWPGCSPTCRCWTTPAG
jgi:DNA polymerase-3 subunit epsilon